MTQQMEQMTKQVNEQMTLQMDQMAEQLDVQMTLQMHHTHPNKRMLYYSIQIQLYYCCIDCFFKKNYHYFHRSRSLLPHECRPSILSLIRLRRASSVIRRGGPFALSSVPRPVSPVPPSGVIRAGLVPYFIRPWLGPKPAPSFIRRRPQSHPARIPVSSELLV